MKIMKYYARGIPLFQVLGVRKYQILKISYLNPTCYRVKTSVRQLLGSVRNSIFEAKIPNTCFLTTQNNKNNLHNKQLLGSVRNSKLAKISSVRKC